MRSLSAPNASTVITSAICAQLSSTEDIDAKPQTASSFRRRIIPISSSNPPAAMISSCVSLSLASLLTNAIVAARIGASRALTAMPTSRSTPSF